MQPEQQPPVNPNSQPEPDYTPPAQQPYGQAQPAVTPELIAPQPDQYAQPVTPPTQTPEQPMTPQRPAEDPGKLLSILGLVCTFIAFHLPGLILSIIGRKRSKKAGYSTTLATVGIVLNSIFMVVTIGVIGLITFLGYQGVQLRTQDANAENTAQSIMKKAEIYATENSTYPTIEQLRSATGAAQLSDTDKVALKDTDTPQTQEVGYKTCTDETQTVTGVNVFIYSASEAKVNELGAAGYCGDSSQQ
jgi:outer membrane biosynthesis protein TonB